MDETEKISVMAGIQSALRLQLHETFELRYTKLSEKYVQQKVGGGTGGNTTSSWNLATIKAT
jgi:hypothetical protein